MSRRTSKLIKTNKLTSGKPKRHRSRVYILARYLSCRSAETEAHKIKTALEK